MAKSPSRPMRRVVLALAGLILLALIAGLALHLSGRAQYARAVARFEKDLGSEIPDPTTEALRAQIATLTPPAPPGLENAATWLMAGAGALVWAEGEIGNLRTLNHTPTAQWTSEQEAHVRRTVDRNRSALDILHRATLLSGSSYGLSYDDLDNLMDGEITDLIELLNAAHLLSVQGRLAFDDGELEHGLESLEALSRLTDTLRQETILVFSLVAHATEKLLLRGISEALISTAPSAAHPEALTRLEELIPQADLLDFTERIVALDAAVVSLYALRGRSVPWTASTESRLRGYLSGHRKAARFLDQGHRVARLARQPYVTLLERFPTPLTSEEDPDDLTEAYLSAVAKAQLAVAQRQLVAAALELRRAGLAQGTYPQPCPALEILETPDPFVGRPLLCQPRDDGSLLVKIPEAAEALERLGLEPTNWLLDLELPAPL